MAKNKNVSLLVSAAGWIAGLVEFLVRALRERGVTDDEIHALVTEKGEALMAKIADVIAEFVKATKKIVYTITVDYATSVDELVKLGKYDWANDNITQKNFPTTRTGKADIEIELIHFDRSISSEKALEEMDRMGYRAAEVHELLAFGVKYPDVQREFPVVALGSVWQDPDGLRDVACLRRDASDRFLSLRAFGRDWTGACRFAAVRK
ncbi:MAG: hypothetical protein Q7T51_01685 [Candidatus Moranbacteria bacterium]|nr:hypothetical protein [Candidatus Moranbacteria bacterium]